MKKNRLKYPPEQKLKMVLEGLSYPDGIGAYCRSKGIRDTLLYRWKEQLESRATDVYAPRKKEGRGEAEYRAKLARKDEIISELAAENIDLKKKYGL